MTMKWADLLGDIRVRLDEPEEGFFRDSELMYFANDGLEDLGTRLMIHRDEKSYDAVAEQAEYEMPDDFVKGYRLEYRQTSTYIVSLEAMPLEMMEETRGVLRSSGWPTAWSTWGYAGQGKIILDRAPSETIEGGLHLFYYRLPRKLTTPEDPVDLPTGWGRHLADYVEWKARRKEAKDNRWREAQELYERGVEEMKRVLTLNTDQPTYFAEGSYGRATQIFGGEY